jgi:integrase
VRDRHAHRFRHTLATEILARGGTMSDVADVLGISENVARKHFAKWSPARQARISEIMRRVFTGTTEETQRATAVQ